MVTQPTNFGLDAKRNNKDENPPNNYYPRGSGTCSESISSNIEVNQDRLKVSAPDLQGRAQAQNETSIAINGNNTNELLAASNDYPRGDGERFPSNSLDKGRTWNDTALPSGFTRGASFGGVAREYWQTCGDPFVMGHDTYGNAYFGGLMFNRGASKYGTEETTGFSDMSLSGSGDLTNWAVNRVTSSSMPPPTEFAGGFMGDYSGLAVSDNAYPLWTDTRNPDVFDCSAPPSRLPWRRAYRRAPGS